VQTLKVSTSIERSVSGDSNSVSYGLCERTVQSIHPTADYEERDRRKATENYKKGKTCEAVRAEKTWKN